MTTTQWEEGALSDTDPILFRPRPALGSSETSGPAGVQAAYVRFDRKELDAILKVYGRMVALGEWRDYAIDLLRDKAVFSVFRRSSEVALYRIEKDPRLARRQGAYCVVAAGGLILKRGPDLERVLRVVDKSQRAITAL